MKYDNLGAYKSYTLFHDGQPFLTSSALVVGTSSHVLDIITYLTDFLNLNARELRSADAYRLGEIDRRFGRGHAYPETTQRNNTLDSQHTILPGRTIS